MSGGNNSRSSFGGNRKESDRHKQNSSPKDHGGVGNMFTEDANQKQNPKMKKSRECEYCKSLPGKQPWHYKSHWKLDKNGEIQCPEFLRLEPCKICGARGKDNHTAKFCPMKPARKAEKNPNFDWSQWDTSSDTDTDTDTFPPPPPPAPSAGSSAVLALS